MKNGFRTAMKATALGTALCVVVWLAPGTIAGQAPAQGAAAAPAGPVVRMPDGKPDLNGYWLGRGSLTNITGAIAEPADKKIPYQPGWGEKAALNNNKLPVNTAFDEPELHCFQSGVPTFMWRQQGPMHWVHTPQYLVMMHEFMGANRTIPLDGRPHIAENIKLFMGDSVGRWEGDTLVVDTTSNNDRTWLDNDGNIHSDQLKVVERFTPMDANTIAFEATLTDAKAYTAPWKITGSMIRNTTGTFQLMEYACVEGNRDIPYYTEAAGGKAKAAPISVPPGSEVPPAAGRGGGNRGAVPPPQ